jgi:glycine/D-amino acid oxidase-like deaminating enzyme
VRACVAGGGLAGAVLAWRLAADLPRDWTLDVLTGRGGPDATSASGGAVRAYEVDPGQRRLAAESLAELLGSPWLRERSGIHPAEAVCLRPSPDGLAAAAAEIEAVLPGSASVADPAELARRGFAGVPPGAAALVERRAGWYAPGRLRDALLADAAARRRVTVRAEPLRSLTVPAGPYDLVVLAAGPWTPGLLRRLGLPAAGCRTKSVQYALHPATGLPPQFVDGLTGLFCRPAGPAQLLVGVPTDGWDADPQAPAADPALPALAAGLARARFPGLRLGPPARVVTAADCYCDPPGLALRPVPGFPSVLTFTGGAGGSAKTAPAAARLAAAHLLAAGPPALTEGS